MSNKTENKINQLGTMKSLHVGESFAMPIKHLMSVRAAASALNTIKGYKAYSTKVNREAGTVTVTRIA